MRPGARILLGLLLPMAACTTLVAPPPVPPRAVDVPAQWSEAASGRAESLHAWWQRFGDRQLDALVEDAIAQNTRVASARAAVQQAQALRDLAGAALWPTLAGSASVQRGRAGGQSTGNRWQAGLDARWSPDVFGGRHSAIDAGEAAALSSAATLVDVQVQIAAEVALDYILLRTTQARLAIAGDNLASQQETLQITQWREQAGLVTALDTEQARAAAAQTRALLPALQTGIAQTMHALSVLSGRAPGTLAAQLAPVLPPPQASDEFTLSIPAETLRRRADVRAAEFGVLAARARVDEAEAARWPDFSLAGSLGTGAATLGALTNGASVVSSIIASLAVPLLDGGAARAQVHVQDAALLQADEAYRAAVLGALKDVEDALVALRGDRLRLDSLRVAAASAASAATLARQRYRSGLVDFQVVLETQRSQLGTQDSVAVARADIAAVAVTVLGDPAAHQGATYDLTGPEALTLAEAAAVIATARGTGVTFHDETLEEAYESRKRWPAPDWQYDAWVSTYTAIAAGDSFSARAHVPGLLWVAYLFAGVLGLNRAFATELDNEALSLLALAPVERGFIFLGKALASLLLLLVVQAATAVAFALAFDLDLWPVAGRLALVASLGAGGLFFAPHALGAVPSPTVTGPIAATAPPGSATRDYPWMATMHNLGAVGYVEQEFFFEGTANTYNTPGPIGTTGSVNSSGHPYKSRMIVRRPTSAAPPTRGVSHTSLTGASTMARSIGSSAMSFTKPPSIFRKSTGRCFR